MNKTRLTEIFNRGFRLGANDRAAGGLLMEDKRRSPNQIPPTPAEFASRPEQIAWSDGYALGYQAGASDAELANGEVPGATGMVTGMSEQMLEMFGLFKKMSDEYSEPLSSVSPQHATKDLSDIDFWNAPFDDSDYFTGPPLSDEMIRAAEEKVGYKLPESYVRLMRIKNGGTLKRDCFPTSVPTSWAEDHVALSGIRGIGGQWGIDSETLGSREMIAEWGYPDVGIIVGECPSAGHDVIMLDYSECGRNGEPRVIHVETETSEAPEILVLAPNFEAFLRGLVDSSRYQSKG